MYTPHDFEPKAPIDDDTAHIARDPVEKDFETIVEETIQRYIAGFSNAEASYEDIQALFANAAEDVDVGLLTREDLVALREIARNTESTNLYNRYTKEMGKIDSASELNRVFNNIIAISHKSRLLCDEHFEQLKIYREIREKYIKHLQTPTDEPDAKKRAAGDY